VAGSVGGDHGWFLLCRWGDACPDVTTVAG
jgi:hypothetical protein